MLSLTDGKNQTIRWNYDQFGRVTNKVDAASVVDFVYQYDADNRLTNRWTPAKSNTGYTYDSVGNLTFIQYPVSPSVTMQYDMLNRLTNMVDAAGTTTYSYTAAGQLLTETGPFASDTVTDVYTNRLRVGLILQQPTGAWTNAFAYDLAGRLAGVTSPAGAFAYQYLAGLPSKLVAQLDLPNGSVITNTYDENARLLGTWLNNSSGTPLDAAIYGYNAGNERLAFTNAAGAYDLYTYDNIGQLKVANSTVSGENRGYLYDAAWNVNYVTNIGSFSVNNLNELTSGPGGTCIYDANGNLIDAALGVNGAPMRFLNGEYCYCYDDENRLTTWRYAALGNSPACGSNPGTNSDAESQFIYDGLGRLRERIDYTTGCGGGDWCWQATNTVFYIYDGMRVIQERNGNNTPTVDFTRGNDLSGSMEGAGGIGGLLARSDEIDNNGNPNRHFYYHADGNGNIMCLESTAQTLAQSCRYDPFGNLVSGSFLEFGFSSKEWFNNGGLYYYGYRWYSPSLQRWLNRDSLGEFGFEIGRRHNANGKHIPSGVAELAQGPNLYEFVRNSPIVEIDFHGLGGGPFAGGVPVGNGGPVYPTGSQPQNNDPDEGSSPGSNPGGDWYESPIWTIGHYGAMPIIGLINACRGGNTPPQLPFPHAPVSTGCDICPVNSPPVVPISSPPSSPPIGIPITPIQPTFPLP